MTTTEAPSAPKTFEEAEAVLAARLPNYESRSQQQALAREIEHCLGSGEHLLGEAGTGTGKSLGYLIPAILSHKRVVVSTATKALQEQLAGKDLPFLQEHLGVAFTWAVLKGRSNYLCADRWLDPETATKIDLGDEIAHWLDEHPDEIAERDAFDFEIPEPQWSALSVSAERCTGTQCPFVAECHSYKAKAKAADADVVVVNHALYATALAIKELTDGYVDLLGEHQVVIFDEAHEFSAYATNAFGGSFFEGSLRALAKDVLAFIRKHGTTEGADRAENAFETLLDALNTIFERFALDPRKSLPRNRRLTFPQRVNELGDVWVNFADGLRAVDKEISGVKVRLSASLGDKKDAQTKTRLHARTRNLQHRVERIAFDEQYAVWIEEETDTRRDARRGATRKLLRFAPVRVGDILSRLLFDPDPDDLADDEEPVQVIAVSATLATQGNFVFAAKQLGCEHYRSIDVGTPFDYPRQAVLYVPQNFPDPSPRTREEWTGAAISEIGRLVKANPGGALVLFTANNDLRTAHRALAPVLDDRTVLVQGQASNKRLAEAFKNDTSSVLFATRSFFTGVDVPGDACSLVVIAKLPFPVPDEPLNDAQCELIRSEGGSDFNDFTIPVTELPLKQAFGRLIRHRDDRGVVAILDNRLLTKGYGRKILRGLPSARLVKQFGEVASFFEGGESDVADAS